MESKIAVVEVMGVRGFVVQDGTVYINTEDALRGFGIVQIKNKVEYVRWDRAEKYLREIGENMSLVRQKTRKKFSPLVGKDIELLEASEYRPEFISESIFYMLAMKANNETAVLFQIKVAYEVIPEIRKKGYFSSIPTEQLIKQLKAEMKKDKDLTPITVYEKLTGKKLVDKKQLLKDQEAERRKWQKERAEEIRRWHAFTMSFDELYTEVEKYAQDAGVSKDAFQAIAAGLNPQACQDVDGVLMFNQFAIRCALKVLFEIRDGRRAG